MRPWCLLAVCAALSPFASSAVAGPPARVCRHVPVSECERRLAPYSALQVLEHEELAPIRPLTGSLSAECGPVPRHRPWVFRCALSIGSGASACRLEARVRREEARVWHVERVRESPGCPA